MSTDTGERELQQAPWHGFTTFLTAVGAPVTIATALLAYFGWVRTSTIARDLGLDVGILGYGLQDFVVRSISGFFTPLLWATVIGIIWLAADSVLRRRLADGRFRKPIGLLARGLVSLGISAGAFLFVSDYFAPEPDSFSVPYSIAVWAFVAGWGLYLGRAVRNRSRPLDIGALFRSKRSLEKLLMFALVTLLLFWGTANYARAVGHGVAAGYESTPSPLGVATVYSRDRLGITAPNVAEQAVGTEAAPLYRYSGLRLLLVSGDKIFLLHDGWTLRSGKVVVLRDDPGVRVEYGNAESK